MTQPSIPPNTRTSSSSWMTTAATTVALGVGVPLVASWITPLTLGALTALRQSVSSSRRHLRGGDSSVQNDDDDDDKTTLLTGRVWHTRFHPVRHAFSYPLFMFGVDLHADDDDRFNDRMWPLSLIMRFSPKHHLINGEGMDDKDDDDDDNNNNKSLCERIYALVGERTRGYLAPTRDTHAVWLVTHLQYYGYCFNPVSFYYLMRRRTGRMEAVVAEVSNTPWSEMYPYVLHPTSHRDRVRYRARQTVVVQDEKEEDGPANTATTTTTTTTSNYRFPKTFHVSPFMEMSYTYDWDFAGEDRVYGGSGDDDDDPRGRPPPVLYVRTALRREEDDAVQFTATTRVRAVGSHPLTLAWQLACYPSYCWMVQMWIHVQAFWLFTKGVTYQPHPTGAETTASRVIGSVMTPLFAVQSWWQTRTGSNHDDDDDDDDDDDKKVVA